MADWFSPRRGLPAMDGNDPLTNGDDRLRALATALDNDVEFDSGPLSSRPTSTSGSPGLAGRLYRVTDATPPRVDLDTGTDWAPNGGLAAFGAFCVYRSTAVSLGNGAVVVFNAEEFDYGGWHNTSNGRFVPQAPGAWRLSATVSVGDAQLDNGTYMRCGIRKNGTAIAYGAVSTEGAAGPAISVATTIAAANGSTDYFDVVFLTNQVTPATTPMTVGRAAMHFCGEYLGRTS